jgi:ribosomal-protein-alanine N-acetyltransferase
VTGAIDYTHVSILRAGPEHAAEIAELHAGLFDAPWSIGSIEELLSRPGSTAFLARLPGPPPAAGFIMGRLAADEAEILSVGVRKDRQRHGIGRRLVESLCRAVRRAGARRLFLEVAQSNAAAVALYRSLGFEVIGRRKDYYQRAGAPPEDALALALVL